MDERQREPLSTEESERMAREWDVTAHPGLWPRAARALLAELDAARGEVERLRAAMIELHDDLGGSAPWPTLEEIRPRLRVALDALPTRDAAAGQRPAAASRKPC